MACILKAYLLIIEVQNKLLLQAVGIIGHQILIVLKFQEEPSIISNVYFDSAMLTKTIL
jgi:hypothetical protein